MANRQVRRKNKKEDRKVIETVGNYEGLGVNKITIIAVILLFFLGFYLLTLLITDNGETKEEEKTTTFSYEEIILGRSLSMSKKEYLVIYYEEDYADTFSEAITNYKNKNELKIYKVDMSNAFNKKYISEESNPNPTKVEEFKINGPTLIKVSNNAVVEYIEGEDNIKNYLN